MNNKVEFEGTVDRLIYNNEESDFYIYAMDVDKQKYPDIKFTKYGNVTICGKMTDLSLTLPYKIEATEEDGKYGPQYVVKTISVIKPKSGEQVYAFLREILTSNQANEIYKNYPNIINLVESNQADKTIDINKLHGIGKKTYIKIKEKIENNIMLFDLVAELGGAITISVIRKLYDEYGSIDLVRKKLRTEPYDSLTRISGIGFIKADAILLDIERNKIINFGFDLKTSAKRCKACMKYYLEENQNNGNTKMDLRDLRQQVVKLVPQCSEHYVSCLRTDDFYYNKEDFSVALRKTYETEVIIAEAIKTANTNPRIWDFDWKSYQNAGEYPLTDEQIRALECICNNNIMILNGFGGSGKSATSSMIIKMLEDNNTSYVLFAPTGRAAKVLSDYTEKPAATIHRGLGYSFGEWGYNEDYKLPYKVVLIDEFSMTDIFLFKHVIDAVDFSCTKLIMVGDSAQLPSVGPGNLLHDFIRSGIIPTVTLNKIFRYADGGLMKVATDVRNSERYLDSTKEKLTTFGDDYCFIQSSNGNITKEAVALFYRLLKTNSVEDILILTAYNKGSCGTIEINDQLQKIVNKNYGSDVCMHCGERLFLKDDIVIQTSNNYKALVYTGKDYKYISEVDIEENTGEKLTFVPNGMTGKILGINEKFAIINFDGVNVIYTKTDMNDVALGYSISIHKSQGGSCKNIILLTPSSHEFMLNSNLIYVGLTRMKEKCYHLGNLQSINRAIRKKENYNRNTFMYSLLKSNLYKGVVQNG